MLSKDARESTFLNQSFLFGTLVLFTTAITLYSFGLYFARTSAEPKFTIDLDRWAWLGDLQITFQKSDGILANHPRSFSLDDPSLMLSFEGPSLADQSINAEFNLTKVPRKFVKVSRKNKSSVEVPTLTDLKKSKGIQFIQELNANESFARMEEFRKMQKLHQTLIEHFSVVVNSQMSTHSNENKVSMVAAAAKKPEFEYSTVTTQLVEREPAKVQDIDLKLKEASQKVDDLLRTQTAFLDRNLSHQHSNSTLRSADSLDSKDDVVFSHSILRGSQGIRGSASFGYLSSAPTASMSSQWSTSKVLLSKNEYSSNRTYHEVRGYSSSPAVVDHSAMNIQIQKSDLQTLAMMLVNESKVNTQSSASSPWEKFQNMVELAEPEFREAFTQDQILVGVQSEMITSEESGAGWRSYRLDGFWPTVTRARPRQTVPLISENSAQLLALTSGSRAQKAAGVVFGKIPPGWTVSLSGRNERGVFLNSDYQAVSSFSVDGERSFAFVNAAPGAQLLILKGQSSRDQGLVAIPVLAGQATHVDLTRLTFRKLAGFVYNAESNDPYPLAGIQVRLSGTSGLDVFTGADGYFEIPEVLTVSDYPVYLETDQAGGFTHRYEIGPDNMDNAILYRLGNQQISEWVDQLEGGVSAESGLAVVAVPSTVMDQAGTRKLRPRITSLLANPSLIPETYTISPSGELKVQRSIYSKLPRFVSVQLSEGPFAAELIDETDQLVWSHLLIAQPRIINILGP